METIMKHREEIERSVASLGQLDVVMARVKLGRRLEGTVPEVGTEGVVSVKEARHPILLLRELENVVGSNVDIGYGKNQGLILTGPNSGGNTIILVSGRRMKHCFVLLNELAANFWAPLFISTTIRNSCQHTCTCHGQNFHFVSRYLCGWTAIGAGLGRP